MSVYDQAHALARALRDCPEYTAIMAAKAKIDADQNASRMLKDFQQLQIAVQKEQILNGEVSADEMKQYEQMYEVISLNPIVKEYLSAEFRLVKMLADIQKILGDAINLDQATNC